MKIKLDDGAKMPTRAHQWDAGLDLYSREGKIVLARGSATFDTGVHVEIPPMNVGFLKSKSGLNIKHDIIGEGVIDEGFTGEIVVKLYNLGDKPYHFERGDKIIQLLVVPVLYPDFEQVDEIEGGERGDSGYGSTGR